MPGLYFMRGRVAVKSYQQFCQEHAISLEKNNIHFSREPFAPSSQWSQ
jgi:hypothetical protein